MTDEKALKILKSIEILAFRDKTKKYFMKDVCDAQKVAIKALEQQPIDGTLEKIRAEIENHCGLVKENHCRYCSYCNSVMGVREILEIIDKYKAEREGEK